MRRWRLLPPQGSAVRTGFMISRWGMSLEVAGDGASKNSEEDLRRWRPACRIADRSNPGWARSKT